MSIHQFATRLILKFFEFAALKKSFIKDSSQPKNFDEKKERKRQKKKK